MLNESEKPDYLLIGLYLLVDGCVEPNLQPCGSPLFSVSPSKDELSGLWIQRPVDATGLAHCAQAIGQAKARQLTMRIAADHVLVPGDKFDLDLVSASQSTDVDVQRALAFEGRTALAVQVEQGQLKARRVVEALVPGYRAVGCGQRHLDARLVLPSGRRWWQARRRSSPR